MEESIRIVEEILKDLKSNRIHGQFTEEQFIKETQALQQLIRGYKELEESNKILQDLYWNECIPTSKIQAKISSLDEDIEYQKMYGNTAQREKLELKKEIYLELLEDK